MEEIRARVIIEGLVQGVFFRASTQDEARRNNLRGWVRNNPDGTVEAVFEGDNTDVQAMIEWCNRGPANAKVTNVNVRFEEYQDEFRDFLINSAF
jgi:acylphosphatase